MPASAPCTAVLVITLFLAAVLRVRAGGGLVALLFICCMLALIGALVGGMDRDGSESRSQHSIVRTRRSSALGMPQYSQFSGISPFF